METDKKNTYENLIQIKNTFSDIKAIEIIDDRHTKQSNISAIILVKGVNLYVENQTIIIIFCTFNI